MYIEPDFLKELPEFIMKMIWIGAVFLPTIKYSHQLIGGQSHEDHR